MTQSPCGTLLRRLLRQRRLTREEFRHLLARRASHMGIAGFVAPSLRSLDRWLAGEVKTAPHPTTCRVLEAECGHPVERLLAPVDAAHRPAGAADAAWQVEPTGPAGPAGSGPRSGAAAHPRLDRVSAALHRVQRLAATLRADLRRVQHELDTLRNHHGSADHAYPAAGASVQPARALVDACQAAGLSVAGARPVADDTWLLPDESVLVTVARGPGATVRSRIAVLVSDHLAARGVPVTEPAPIPSGRAAPIVDGGVNDVATTFWQHTEPLPEPPGHVVDSLVDTVRAVHEVAGPLPVPLPRYRPLAMVTDVLARAGTSPEAALDGDGDPGSAARAMLALMVRRLQVRCQRLRGVLGDGLIHGRPDAGLRRWGDRLVLGDWRSACVGPREVDLVRLCRDARLTTSEVDKAMARYGWDVRGWGDYQTLCAVEDCRAVASLVGRSTASPVAAAELARRVDGIWATYRGCRW